MSDIDMIPPAMSERASAVSLPVIPQAEPRGVSGIGTVDVPKHERAGLDDAVDGPVPATTNAPAMSRIIG
jgi:hypothetical protein